MHSIVCRFRCEQAMQRTAIMAFLRSREGAGLIGIVFFAAVLAVVGGYGFYQASLRAFIENKTEEKATALQLVDAFVSNYSNFLFFLNTGRPPIPPPFPSPPLSR